MENLSFSASSSLCQFAFLIIITVVKIGWLSTVLQSGRSFFVLSSGLPALPLCTVAHAVCVGLGRPPGFHPPPGVFMQPWGRRAPAELLPCSAAEASSHGAGGVELWITPQLGLPASHWSACFPVPAALPLAQLPASASKMWQVMVRVCCGWALLPRNVASLCLSAWSLSSWEPRMSCSIYTSLISLSDQGCGVFKNSAFKRCLVLVPQ